MIEGHISRAYDGALSALHMRVVEMGGLALDQVREATRAYAEWDPSAAELVIERERTINAYDVMLDEEQLALIARRQPVASDLRVIIALSKMVAELERIGDESKKIARLVLTDAGRPGRATARDARHLGQLAVALLRRSLEALDALEHTRADEVIAGDKELDAEYAAGLRRLMTRAMEDPRNFEVAVQAAFVLKSLERIGDHARNLARYLQSMHPELAAHAQAPLPQA